MNDADVARRVALLASTDTGRGSERLAVSVLEDLDAAAEMLLSSDALHVGIITGFYIPRAQPPAAETDGPLGAVLIARTLANLGATVAITTDALCEPVVSAALGAVCGERITVQVWPDVHTSAWTHVISIERVGRTADGTYRNMLGVDITQFTAPIDSMFESLGVPRIAIGDGGNEIGMGKLSSAIIAETVDKGALIRCVVDCDYLIVAGTSNWGGYALAAILAARAGFETDVLDEATARNVLDAIVAAGGVDGISATSRPTVDGLNWGEFWAIPRRIGEVLVG